VSGKLFLTSETTHLSTVSW